MSFALMIVGMLVAIAGSLIIIVAAFRESVLWGLGSIFVPFVLLVFVAMHWQETKAGFFWMIGGASLIVIAAILAPGAEASPIQIR